MLAYKFPIRPRKSRNQDSVALNPDHPMERAPSAAARIHVVAVPYPAHGHIVPLMQLCENLVREEAYTVTFVNTEHNHARLVQAQASRPDQAQYYDSENSILNRIRLVGIPGGLRPELHGHSEYVVAAFQASEELAEPFERLLDKLNEEAEEPVSCIVSDVLMSWTQQTADRLGIPRLAFWTSSAAVYSVVWHTYLLATSQSQTLPSGFRSVSTPLEDSNHVVSCIPGLPPMDLNDLPIIVRSDPADFIYQFLMRQLRPLERAAGVVLNTFHELEEQCIDALLPPPGGVPLYAVGPLLPPALVSMQIGACGGERNGECDDAGMCYVNRSAGIFPEDAVCLEWLKDREPASVLYISFGSIFTMSAEQLVELAEGLESSQQAFLWAIRPDFVEGGFMDSLPPSFLKNTKSRGLLVPWCPQLQVLSHPSIAGFLTHCGWNSTVESLAFGVPMLCWPDVGERRTNGRLVVSIWGVGLEFSKTEDGAVSRWEVERIVRKLMTKDEGNAQHYVRSRAATLREAAVKAVGKGGSSSHAWSMVLADLRKLTMALPRK